MSDNALAAGVAVAIELERKRARPRCEHLHCALSAAEITDDLGHLREMILEVPPVATESLSGWPYDSIRGVWAKGRVAAIVGASEGLGPIDMASLLVLHQHHLPLNGA